MFLWSSNSYTLYLYLILYEKKVQVSRYPAVELFIVLFITWLSSASSYELYNTSKL
jgi:hypothetical protein